MTWDPLTTPVDFVLIAGRKTPGLAEVKGANTPRKWDERVGPGLSGSSSVFMGRRLAHPEIHIKLLTPKDWADWYAFKPTVDRLPNGKWPRALEVVHPWFRDADIKAIGIEDVMQPEPDGTGAHVIAIKCIEHRRLRLTLAKPEAAAIAPPSDPYDIMINNLTNQLNDLANG